MRFALLLLLLFGIRARAGYGGLMIYNCLGESKAVIPYMNEDALYRRPMQSGTSSSGMLFPVGGYKLSARGDEVSLDAVKVRIEKGKTLHVVLVMLSKSKTETRVPRMVQLNTKVKKLEQEVGFVPLRVRSFSQRVISLELGFTTLKVPALQSRRVEKWKGGALQVTLNKTSSWGVQTEDDDPHVLLVWDQLGGQYGIQLLPLVSLVNDSVPSLEPKQRKALPALEELRGVKPLVSSD